MSQLYWHGGIVAAYRAFKDEPGLTRVATLEQVREQGGNLSIPLYVAKVESTTAANGATSRCATPGSLSQWLASGTKVRRVLSAVLRQKLPTFDLPPVTTIRQESPAWLKRAEWRRLPFGAFVDSVNERVEPADAAEEIYVGLDDLDPGSPHIRRWGKGSDVIGTKLRFKTGDIIFGRRRAYQRKLAVADSEGICSAHAMVVRAKRDQYCRDFCLF